MPATHPTGIEHEIDAVLFDIDGTLVDSTAAVERVWRAWGERLSVDPDSILAISHGRRSEDVIAHFLPPEQCAAALVEYEQIEMGELAESAALPGTRDLLALLPRERWAAVTSGRREVMTARLLAAGLPVPEVLVSAEDVTGGKPDPEGYRLAARLLGVAAERCLVVEDAPAGIEAGNAAGAVTIGVATSHPREVLTHATHVVPDLTAVRMQPVGSVIRVSTL